VLENYSNNDQFLGNISNFKSWYKWNNYLAIKQFDSAWKLDVNTLL